jgi:hypothetical protein
LVVAIPAVVVAAVAMLLLAHYTLTGAVTSENRLDVAKTGLGAGAGVGALITLILAVRRQTHTELAQRATERAQETAERDATERRITDLYGRAVDQFGSDKAPVRLGGLYALERLAQDNPGQRPTIVAVICAYLRMPYRPPDEQPTNPDGTVVLEPAEFEARAQEREVRVAAQRILTDHLRPGPNHPADTFWAGTTLDLAGATLIDLDLTGCHTTAHFTRATFTGDTRFNRATLTDAASFDQAVFTHTASFGGATFTNTASFSGAVFTDTTWFDGATFTNAASFGGATFADTARFEEATFLDTARFDRVRFAGTARFDETTFAGTASFDETTFAAAASYDEARFAGPTWFGRATFTGPASFDGASFTGDVGMHGCWAFLNRAHANMWPSGWSVTPTPERPNGMTEGAWGRLTNTPPASPTG